MTVTFVTFRKTKLLLTAEVANEIQRSIRRNPKYWADMLLSCISFSMRFLFQMTALGFVLCLFIALYIGRMDWDTVVSIWRSLVFPLMWVSIILFTMFSVFIERPLFPIDVYEKYLSREIENRFAGLLEETVTVEPVNAKNNKAVRQPS